MGATAAAPAAHAASSRSSGPLDGLDDLLTYGLPRPAGEASVPTVAAAVQESRTQFLACRYTDLARTLPQRLALAQALGDDAGHTATAQLWCVASRVAIKCGDDRMTAVAADRAVTAAARASSPLVMAEALRMVSSAHRRHGQHERATQVAVRAADMLDSAHDTHRTGLLSTRGNLLATAAYSAAKAGDGPGARDLLNAARFHDRELGRSIKAPGACGYFGPAQVALHEVSVHHLLGDAGAAIATARGIPTTGLPRERRVRLHWEMARAHLLWGRDRECLAQLFEIERLAAQDVRRPAAHALALDLARRAQPVPGALAFTRRIGAA
ncbi:XRE family transcriptional regulator [Streptomyces sp. NPDC058045]|uniref:XRE family transcriptional regulator n=1 Tax=Streptomyces sp. NPDC058045 TaxID=3346311 RepID=UPI0036E576AD